jgi:mRNA-decapping enzyme 1B
MNNLLQSAVIQQPLQQQQQQQPIQIINKPTLITPTMFQASAIEDKAILGIQQAPGVAPQSTNFVRPEPLTNNQLVQALNYLLENDPEFIRKIHEAYVKSFNKILPL